MKQAPSGCEVGRSGLGFEVRARGLMNEIIGKGLRRERGMKAEVARFYTGGKDSSDLDLQGRWCALLGIEAGKVEGEALIGEGPMGMLPLDGESGGFEKGLANEGDLLPREFAFCFGAS